MSDLHLEFDGMQSVPIEGDVLILAGDITLASCLNPKKTDAKSRSVRKATHRLLDMAVESFDQTLVIGGNHEPYGGEISESEALCRKYVSRRGVRWLENEIVEIGGVAFIFATLWTNMNRRDPLTMLDVGQGMNDFHLIGAGADRWTTGMAADRFDRSFSFIEAAVAARDNQKTVVVTHHAPTFRGIRPEYQNHQLNGGYASALDEFIIAHPQIQHWVFGHTHVVAEFVIGSTQMHANCRGYPDENTGFNVDAYFVI